MEHSTHKATFAAGCFWGPEEAFRILPGVIETRVGYTGGHIPNPSYEHVCTGTTGHAEAVEIIFDPTHISYEDLLQKFWTIHDPTQMNRQGPDIGNQYRSAIFYHTDEQKEIAEQSKDEHIANGKAVVTEITPASEFFPAEEYHQKYIMKGGNAVCHI